MTHLHASTGACRTLCGLPCEGVSVAYAHLNPEDATCPGCVAEYEFPTSGPALGSKLNHLNRRYPSE